MGREEGSQVDRKEGTRRPHGDHVGGEFLDILLGVVHSPLHLIVPNIPVFARLTGEDTKLAASRWRNGNETNPDYMSCVPLTTDPDTHCGPERTVSGGFLMSKCHISLLQTVAFGRTIRQQGTLDEEVSSIKLAEHTPLATGSGRSEAWATPAAPVARGLPRDVQFQSRRTVCPPRHSLPGSRSCGIHVQTQRAPHMPDACSPLFHAVRQRSNHLSVCSSRYTCFVELEGRGNGTGSSESKDLVPEDSEQSFLIQRDSKSTVQTSTLFQSSEKK